MGLLRRALRKRLFCSFWTAGVLFQFGGCDLGQITTTVTLDARDLLINVVRGAVLTPLDQFITDRINAAFGADNP